MKTSTPASRRATAVFIFLYVIPLLGHSEIPDAGLEMCTKQPDESLLGLSDGLVGAYTMNNSSADSSGNEHHGYTDKVTKTTNRFGDAGMAYNFDGVESVMTIPDRDDFSVNTTGDLSISVWVRPEGTSLDENGELLFENKEASGYVHWLGKGETYGATGNQEWSFRIYSADNSDEPHRHNRMSVYHFQNSGGKGPGSYVEKERITVGEWIHYVAIISQKDRIICWFKNGTLEDVDTTAGEFAIPDDKWLNGNAPVRLGSQNPSGNLDSSGNIVDRSFFKGAIDNLYFYNRKLSYQNIKDLHKDTTK